MLQCSELWNILWWAASCDETLWLKWGCGVLSSDNALHLGCRYPVNRYINWHSFFRGICVRKLHRGTVAAWRRPGFFIDFTWKGGFKIKPRQEPYKLQSNMKYGEPDGRRLSWEKLALKVGLLYAVSWPGHYNTFHCCPEMWTAAWACVHNHFFNI